MDDYIIIELFPKSYFLPVCIQGGIEFSFKQKKCFLIAEENPIEFKIASDYLIHNYRRVHLYIKNDGEYGKYIDNRSSPLFNSPKLQSKLFRYTQRVCDILSLATNIYNNQFSDKKFEYAPLSSGWSYSQSEPKVSSGFLKYLNQNYTFLDTKLLKSIIKKIENSQYKKRIFSSLHLNRLAKYKMFCAPTEALTDFVSSLEALYMEEKNGKQDQIDCNIIKIKNGGNTKTASLGYFLSNYSTEKKKVVNSIINKIKPYTVRSAYLHRGFLKEPHDGLNWRLSFPKNKVAYNKFYNLAVSTILNFILNYA